MSLTALLYHEYCSAAKYTDWRSLNCHLPEANKISELPSEVNKTELIYQRRRIINKTYDYPKGKGTFISLSSLAWGKFLMLCTSTCSFTRANDAKIMRSRNAQCNTNLAKAFFRRRIIILLTIISSEFIVSSTNPQRVNQKQMTKVTLV